MVNISVGLKPKIPKEPQFLCFGTENFEQFRFQPIEVPANLGSNTKALGSTLVWGLNGVEMEPEWKRTRTKMRQMQIPPENLVPKPWYGESGTRTEVPEPVPWNRRNQGFSTETGTELKNQDRTNTSQNVDHNIV